MNPRFPIFVPTKGRYESRLTIKAFEAMEIPYFAVIEEQEFEQYAQYIDSEKIIVLPHRDKGLTVTRNWIWDYAQNELKTPYFWTFDDNIRRFYRLTNNIKYRLVSGTALYVIEEFVQRYKNLFITGMQYEMFVPRKTRVPPLTLNTRVYSNMLIKTNIPFRNETFYNDDTDLCLRVLKSGACTCLFNAFLADKITTMITKGGMTDYYERTTKRLEFAQELQRAHPDVTKIVWKYNRWHHKVDYKPFKKNKLILKDGVQIKKGINNFGMALTEPCTL